jgi:hypothetical protein
MGHRNEVEALDAEFSKRSDNQDSFSVANRYAANAKLLPPGVTACGRP